MQHKTTEVVTTICRQEARSKLGLWIIRWLSWQHASFQGWLRCSEFITGEILRQGKIGGREEPNGVRLVSKPPRRKEILATKVRTRTCGFDTSRDASSALALRSALAGLLNHRFHLYYLPLALEHRLILQNPLRRKNGQIESRRFAQHQFSDVPPHGVTLLEPVP